MSTSRTSTLALRLQQFDVNPVWVKDLRQAARNRFVSGALMLVLALFLLVSVTIASNGRNHGISYAGGQVFQSISSITIVVANIFLPVYFFTRTLMERASGNGDLLYITKMTPQQIVRGKFLSAAYMTLLFYSVALPFLMAGYLFRGVDIPTILISFGFNTTANLLLALVAIALALASISIIIKIAVGVVVGFCAFVFGVTRFSLGLVMDPGIGDSALQWQAILTYTANFLLLAGLAYQISVAMVSPVSANRALPARRYLTATAFLVLAQFFGQAWHNDSPELAVSGYITVGICILFCFLVACSTAQAPFGHRIRKDIPKNSLKRIPAFFFFSGKFAGFCWLLGLWMATLAAFTVFILAWGQSKTGSFFPSEKDPLAATIGFSLFVFYAFAYSLLATWVQRVFFPRANTAVAGLVFLLMVGVPALLTLFMTMPNGIRHPLGENPIPGMMLNLVPIIERSSEHGIYLHLASTQVLILLGIALNWKWIWGQFRDFKPLDAHQGEPHP